MRDTISESQVVLGIMAGTDVRPCPNLVSEICRLANKHRSMGVVIKDTKEGFNPAGTLAVLEDGPMIDNGWLVLIKPSAYITDEWTPEHAAAIRAANDKYGLDWLLDPQ